MMTSRGMDKSWLQCSEAGGYLQTPFNLSWVETSPDSTQELTVITPGGYL